MKSRVICNYTVCKDDIRKVLTAAIINFLSLQRILASWTFLLRGLKRVVAQHGA